MRFRVGNAEEQPDQMATAESFVSAVVEMDRQAAEGKDPVSIQTLGLGDFVLAGVFNGQRVVPDADDLEIWML